MAVRFPDNKIKPLQFVRAQQLKPHHRGQQEPPSKTSLPEHDPKCYLCPGNKRAQGDSNPTYTNTFTFVNDYSAVKDEQVPFCMDYSDYSDHDLSSRLLQAQPVVGSCYVLTFSPKHNVTLADMSADEIIPVIETWTRMYATHVSASSALAQTAAECLSGLPPSDAELPSPPKVPLRYMQIFENKGAAMGCSNPHPHCQVWTTSTMPEEPGIELRNMMAYRAQHGGSHLLGDYVKLENDKQERGVWQNEAFLVVCPWWAVWPYEVLIIPKRHIRAMVDLSPDERLQFAEAIQDVTRRYDNLFECHFPYSMFLFCD